MKGKDKKELKRRKQRIILVCEKGGKFWKKLKGKGGEEEGKEEKAKEEKIIKAKLLKRKLYYKVH